MPKVRPIEPYWQHRGITLYLGDARQIVPMLRDVDFVFTDPPYGHNNNDGKDLISVIERAVPKRQKVINGKRLGYTPQDYSPRPIRNDGQEADELFRTTLPLLRDATTDNAVICYCGGGGGPDPQFARWSLWLDEVFYFKQMVVWDKGKMGMGWHYRRSYETVLVAQKDKHDCPWYDSSGRIENIIRPGDYGIRKIIPSATDHPTVKPVELSTHFLRLHTLVGQTCLDPFMGSGSTGVSCALWGRKFIGIDIDEGHVKEAKRRIRHALSLDVISDDILEELDA